jgi:type II secretory pathway pseudopilin PulG
MQPPDPRNIAPRLAPCQRSLNTGSLRAKSTRWKESGFTLAEIAVALGIFSFALVSMMGMLSVGLKNSRKATVQTSASNVMAGVVSDIKASTITAPNQGSVNEIYTYTSPKLGISADLNKSTNTVPSSSIKPGMPLYINESCSLVDSKSPEVLQKVYSIQIYAGAAGVPALRVRVEWPALRQPNSRPEGFVEALVPLPL